MHFAKQRGRRFAGSCNDLDISCFSLQTIGPVAHPAIAASLVDHAGGYAATYGTSELDSAVERRFSEIFERDVAVLFVGTGTAANSLSLSLLSKPGGIAFGHRRGPYHRR